MAIINLDDSGWWQALTAVIIATCTGATFWIGWGLRRAFVSRADFESEMRRNEERDNRTDERLIKVEVQLANSPTKEAFHNMSLQLQTLETEIRWLRDTTDRTDERLGVIYEALIDKDK